MSTSTIPPDLIPYLTHEKQDNSSVQNSIVTINSVFLVFICVTTGLRLWVRFRMLRSTGLDDILIIVALIFATFLSISSLVGESLGLGKHIWNLSPVLTDIPSATGKITKALYGAYLSYSTAITFTKFSIMATYVRIFPHGILRNTVYGTAIVVLCFWISSIFAIIFTCVPVSAAWDYNLKGHCYPIVNFFYASSAFNIATDVLLCVLPIPTLWALKLPKPQRTVLIILFSMGTFACVASILRLAHLNHLGSGSDVTYQTVSSLNWSVVEVDTGIVCASLSSLRPLGKRLIPNLFSQSSRASSPTEKNGLTNSLTRTNTYTASQTFTSRFLPPPPKIMRFNAIMSPIPTRPSRSGSIASVKSEIYVQKTFEVQTMKDLPAIPDPFRAPSRMADVGDVVQVQVPQNISHGTHTRIDSVEDVVQVDIPQLMSSISKGKGKEKEETMEVATEAPTLKWPTRTLTKGKHERDSSRSRLSVVGMFTADLLDFTSSEDEGLTTGRSSSESEDTIKGELQTEAGSSES
ncbi:uncharacterized protein LY89DRAFT_663009 [Mollisia scopiformis]|uniref:Rhodopsin domain-containing protein n=1 Tax=Mollisia scopiformis TaxID=149040 RepID=A0A194XV97_MOLSC|nr:uncharacterized protein LY89DRAFT_663009 [Mollisia scopiformis]KUJ24255.1 hypothetical protein LY89DRAFT_663009 [Mollisia scopiformis]